MRSFLWLADRILDLNLNIVVTVTGTCLDQMLRAMQFLAVVAGTEASWLLGGTHHLPELWWEQGGAVRFSEPVVEPLVVVGGMPRSRLGL